MFCTSKERETCDVEKRGCEGCFYMNEEKVKIIELERRDPQSEAKYWNQKYTETLLKLFNEEEKNKKLIEGIKEIKDKLEIADDYFTNDAVDDLTRLLGEVKE